MLLTNNVKTKTKRTFIGGAFLMPTEHPVIASRFLNRIKIELDKLEKNGYQIDLQHFNDKNTIKVEKEKNVFEIEFKSNYPFDRRVINGFKYLDSNPSFTLEQNIEQYRKKKILVYCHPRKVDQPPNHFLLDFFRLKLQEQNLQPNDYQFYTIDTQDNGTQNIKEDGFGEDFLNANLNEFDMVFLPDCGGKWFEVQQKKPFSPDEMIELLRNVLTIVKPGGKLLASKFTVGGLRESLREAFPGTTLMEESRYNTEWIEIPKELKTRMPPTITPSTMMPQTMMPPTITPSTMMPQTITPPKNDLVFSNYDNKTKHATFCDVAGKCFIISAAAIALGAKAMGYYGGKTRKKRKNNKKRFKSLKNK